MNVTISKYEGAETNISIRFGSGEYPNFENCTVTQNELLGLSQNSHHVVNDGSRMIQSYFSSIYLVSPSCLDQRVEGRSSVPVFVVRLGNCPKFWGTILKIAKKYGEKPFRIEMKTDSFCRPSNKPNSLLPWPKILSHLDGLYKPEVKKRALLDFFKALDLEYRQKLQRRLSQVLNDQGNFWVRDSHEIDLSCGYRSGIIRDRNSASFSEHS